MSEAVEHLKTLDQLSQERRAGNRQNSAQMLADRGIAFTVHNLGAHLVVRHGDRTFDFWPGTGKWIERGTRRYKRGVFNLIKALGT